MTDRHNAYIVILEEPIREDNAEPIRNALSMVKGVLSVQPLPDDGMQLIADERAYSRIQRQLLDVAFANRETA